MKSIFIPELNLRVSEYGEISRLNRNGRKVYAHNSCKAGYLRIGVTTKGIRRSFSVHRLVALAFLPNPDSLPEVNHLDFNKSNNHYSNLEWCTHKQNQHHLINSGNWNPANRLGKFTTKERNAKVYKAYKTGLSTNELAVMFSIGIQNTRRIIREAKRI